MKMEHKAIIERARLADIPPSMLAHELLVHDLVNAGLFELKNIHSPYGKLNEGQQQEVIERLTQAANEAAHNAIAIISSRNISTIEMTMKEVKFNSKQLTLTSIVDAKNPNRHDLIDSAGHLCLLVMVPNDYDEGLDFIQPDRDQKDLPLHSSELTGNLFEQPTGPDEPEYVPASAIDELYGAAVEFVVTSQRATVSSVQRELKISYNRAAALIDALEQEGVVSAMDHTGDRVVLMQVVPESDDAEFAEVGGPTPDGKEFGEFTYEDAAQLVVLHAKVVDVTWLQRRLAVDSDQATTLLLRLVDNNVIQLETEAEQSIDNTYTVIGDLSATLSLE
jgi:S-DNA-T family DNA segregation ATPase FtsK/SpoIIIE